MALSSRSYFVHIVQATFIEDFKVSDPPIVSLPVDILIPSLKVTSPTHQRWCAAADHLFTRLSFMQ